MATKHFEVLSVSREDFKAVGYNADHLTDEEMEYMASVMHSTLLGGGDYWLFLKYWAVDNNFPKYED